MLTEMYERWLFEVWQKGDEQASRELVADDLVDHNALPGQPAGRAGDLWAAAAVRKAFPDLQFTLDVCFESWDHVTGRWTMKGTHLGTLDFLGIPPTGRPITMSGQEIFRVENGKFVELWHAEDIGAFQRAAELVPPAFALKLAAKRSAKKYRKQKG